MSLKNFKHKPKALNFNSQRSKNPIFLPRLYVKMLNQTEPEIFTKAKLERRFSSTFLKRDEKSENIFCLHFFGVKLEQVSLCNL